MRPVIIVFPDIRAKVCRFCSRKVPVKGDIGCGGAILIVLGLGFVVNVCAGTNSYSPSYTSSSNTSSVSSSSASDSSSDDDVYTPTVYKVTQSGYYCTFSKDDFNRYLDIMNARDGQAMAEMVIDGRAIRLEHGQEAYL